MKKKMVARVIVLSEITFWHIYTTSEKYCFRSSYMDHSNCEETQPGGWNDIIKISHNETDAPIAQGMKSFMKLDTPLNIYSWYNKTPLWNQWGSHSRMNLHSKMLCAIIKPLTKSETRTKLPTSRPAYHLLLAKQFAKWLLPYAVPSFYTCS